VVLKSSEEESNEKISKSLWFQPPEWTKTISWGSLLFGTFFGGLLVLAGLFIPFYLDERDYQMLQQKAASTATSSPSAAAAAKNRADNSLEGLRKSVTLFEDILYDLRDGYVDELDYNKLFETGVGAMLRSLDPYTEFENMKQAQGLQESVAGKYGGVGLVITNSKEKPAMPRLPPRLSAPAATNPLVAPPSPPLAPLPGGSDASPESSPLLLDQEVDEQEKQDTITTQNGNKKNNKGYGVTVVDAFEGYAFDAGMRVGDRLLSVGGVDARDLGVEGVRDLLRGEPDTDVVVTFTRDEFVPSSSSSSATTTTAVPNVHSVTLKRKDVRMSDVRLACFLGPQKDGIGYINLSGFNSLAGRDFRQALLMLKYGSLANSPNGLQGLVLDLRGNPGGLLDAAVEVASYLVPENSEIVSAKSRSGPEITYRSSMMPIRPPNMKLVVLVNSGSASASEIVSGAIQDLDQGVIMGPSRTYGKGLVQKITPLPYDSALKYTIAKYYTPSGRCIQSIKYSGGREEELLAAASPPPGAGQINGGSEGKEGAAAATDGDGRYGDEQEEEVEEEDEEEEQQQERGKGPKNGRGGSQTESVDGARKVSEKDRQTFYTRAGRPVRDGGGIEPDVTVPLLTAGPAESIFLSKGTFTDFISEFVRSHNVLEPLHTLVESERLERLDDERFGKGTFGNAVAQFLVLEDSNQVLNKPGMAAGGNIGGTTNAMGRPTHKQLFADFSKFVEKKVKAGEIDLLGGLGSKVNSLSKVLKAEGFDDAVQNLDTTKVKIVNDVLRDMNKNQDSIADMIEFSLLSREMPDRLLLWKAVVNDIEVQAARDIMLEGGEVVNLKAKGSSSSSGSKISSSSSQSGSSRSSISGGGSSSSGSSSSDGVKVQYAKLLLPP